VVDEEIWRKNTITRFYIKSGVSLGIRHPSMPKCSEREAQEKPVHWSQEEFSSSLVSLKP
jgi:hypothetical protein